MSVSSLPEWKQLLLEKKRREEEERERREKEEEEKLASMPAWKRGIIQRRKAKQDSVGDKEKDRDVCFLQVDARSIPSDGLSDTDTSVTVHLGSERSLSPDPGHWMDADPKSVSQVSMETIVPLHENPFIRTQSAWRKGRDADTRHDSEIKEKDKMSPCGQDEELGRGREIEVKMERFRDLSEVREKGRGQPRERDNSRERWGKDKSQWKESVKVTREKVREDEEGKNSDPPFGSFSSVVPCLRTIRADNIIIIEQDRKGSDERWGRWKEAERERTDEEDHQEKRGMKMDLREILAGGRSVTEIRASEVLIIKPLAGSEEKNTVGKGREDGEMMCGKNVGRENIDRELRTDMSWMREKESIKEKERPWGQATVIKEDRRDNADDNVFVEKGGRVSQLLSKFGEMPKPPCRSKSSDNFLCPRRQYSGDEDDQQFEEGRTDERNMSLKGVPKRSFSFSNRVICAKENGLDNERRRERIHSDKSVGPWVNAAGLGKEATAKMKLGCARLLDRDRSGKHRDGYVRNDEKCGPAPRRHEEERFIHNRSGVKKVEHIDKRVGGDGDGDEGFMVASVKNTEGISFARRVPIRQDGKARAEREVKQVKGEKSLEGKLSVEKDSEAGGQIETQVRGDGFENAIFPETIQSCVVTASAGMARERLTAESHHRHESAFTECSTILQSTATDQASHPHCGSEWSGAGSRGPNLTYSVLSHHTEELISKIGKIGEATVYNKESGERAYKSAHDLTREPLKEGQQTCNVGLENQVHDITPKSSKIITPPGSLEIQIPRTVFYVAEEMMEEKKAADQNDEEEGGQERKDSWRIGKPLSHTESPQEKIRQRETQDGEEIVAAEMIDTWIDGETYDEMGTEMEQEEEAADHMRKELDETDTVQEDTAAQALIAAFDVTQEVLKTCPQLPVSVPHSQGIGAEEVTSGYASAAAEVISDSLQIPEDEDDPLNEIEEELLRCHGGRRENREEERDWEEKELSEEEVEEYTSTLDSTQSLSPSSPHPNSLAAMSRIYNLEKVGSRSGLCLRDRTVEISSVHLVQVTPHISNTQQTDTKALPAEDICVVQTIHRQIEQLQLKEQEALKTCSSQNITLKDKETKRQQSPRGVLKHPVKDVVKNQEKDLSDSNYRMSPVHVSSPTSQLKQTITVNSAFLRSQSPDNCLKPFDSAPTPASSPCSLSPSQSPRGSPSPTPSPTLFSIRSASGGQVKRGATITVNPKRNIAASGSGGTGSTTGSPSGPTLGSTSARTTPSKPPSQQTQMTPSVAESAKKKYPTAEEIEVIGGYLNLERSCLVKHRGIPKRVKVCFDEDQLEQVCEYPSETSMLACTPHPHDLGKQDSFPETEGQEEEAEVEKGAITSKSTRNIGTALGHRLRVDESCPRSSSPKLPL